MIRPQILFRVFGLDPKPYLKFRVRTWTQTPETLIFIESLHPNLVSGPGPWTPIPIQT